VDAAARRVAGALAHRGPIALRYVKEAVVRALDLPLADGIRLEHDLYVLLQTTTDRREGVRAFLERRPPRFEAR
jgi:enoyl-CoA hydratase/carnithine racemase